MSFTCLRQTPSSAPVGRRDAYPVRDASPDLITIAARPRGQSNPRRRSFAATTIAICERRNAYGEAPPCFCRRSRLLIGRINDALVDIGRIAHLYEIADKWAGRGFTLPLDFTDCDFLRPTAVAALGGIIAHIESKGGTAPILRGSLQPRVRDALTKNGFLAAHGIDVQAYANNAVAYHHDRTPNADAFARFLAEEWLSRNWISLSRDVRQEIIQSVVELYNNAFEHGQANGFFTCGQKFPNSEEVTMAFLDFGCTIPRTVLSVRANASMRDHESIMWALQPGNTSKPGFSRGLGFDVLMDLVGGEGSHLEIYSGRGTLRAVGRKPVARPLDFRFPGTLIQVTVSTAGVSKMQAERPKPVIRF